VRQAGESVNEFSRKHEVAVDKQRNLITIAGGKLTTFRAMAEKSVDEVAILLGREEIPTGLRQRLRTSPLWPAMKREDGERLGAQLRRRLAAADVADDLVDHWVKLYGSHASLIADRVAMDASLGRRLVDGLPYCPAELVYICEAEWVTHLVDLVKRRTSMYFLAGRKTLGALEETLPQIAATLHWDPKRSENELASVREEFDADGLGIREYSSKLDGRSIPACA
jgi:glycerol-3-phosphate dehydrogenase